MNIQKQISFIQIVKSIKWHLFLGVLLSCVAALSNFGLLFLSGWFITSAAIAGLGGLAVSQAFNILLPASGVRFFATCRILTRYLERIVIHDGALRITSILRTTIYKCLIPITPAGLVDKRGGDLLGQFVSDTDNVSAYYTDTFIPFIRAIICSFVFVGIFFFFLHAAAVTLCVALIGVGFIVPVVTYYVSYRHVEKILLLRRGMQADIAETLYHFNELFIFNAMHKYMYKINHSQQHIDQSKLSLDLIETVARAVVILIMMISVLFILLQSTQAYHNHLLDVAEIPMLILGVLAAFDVMFPLPLACHALIKARLSQKELQNLGSSVTTNIEDIFVSDDFLQPTALIFDQVFFSYPYSSQIILDHASLKIEQGNHTALTGESGVGKSSLVNMLFAFYPLQSGSILLGEQDVKHLSPEIISSYISVVSQDSHLFTGTIQDNLKLIVPDVTDDEIDCVLETVLLKEFVSSLPDGIYTVIGNEGTRLSGGQAKRLAIAQGILRNTPWLILDEPTEGLDQQTEQRLMHNLLQQCADKTLIIITHKHEILSFMKHVVLLENASFNEIA